MPDPDMRRGVPDAVLAAFIEAKGARAAREAVGLPPEPSRRDRLAYAVARLRERLSRR